ncbi:MAG TPA: FAD-binding oxidoreductase [Nocardioidaceae bacterium]|nr:FAD-binding oxidoreductase [Nocardioidaceae bacterium]
MADLRWGVWGIDADRMTLSDQVIDLLRQGLGVDPAAAPPKVRPGAVDLPEPVLKPAARDALTTVVGADHVRLDRDSRLLHVGGKSTTDLWRRRAGDADDAPDAVVLPAKHDEVIDVLKECSEHGVAVVPFGGGTSVVGGVEPARGAFRSVLALDLSRMARLVDVDERSMTARLEPGLTGPEAERLLNAQGLTVGHFPQSFEYATVGGFAATRSAGQASSGYGRFDELVEALRIATPSGSLELGRAPASAAGPDLRQLFLGSEGTLGVVTEVTVRVRPVPEAVLDEAWLFADFATGADAVRQLAQGGALPTVTRLSDEAETAVNLAMGGDVDTESPATGGCLLIASHEGTSASVAAAEKATTALLRESGGTPLAADIGHGWRSGRYRGPYLRDALLDAGAQVETLETATTWARLDALGAAVRDALTTELTGAGTPPLVLCHISHAYPTGASLYFTVVAKAASDPIAQWAAAKRAASEAISRQGATITHHHAVGLDHRPWMESEIGSLGIEVLRAVKTTLDPIGVLNPGKLIPPA